MILRLFIVCSSLHHICIESERPIQSHIRFTSLRARCVQWHIYSLSLAFRVFSLLRTERAHIYNFFYLLLTPFILSYYIYYCQLHTRMRQDTIYIGAQIYTIAMWNRCKWRKRLATGYILCACRYRCFLRARAIFIGRYTIYSQHTIARAPLIYCIDSIIINSPISASQCAYLYSRLSLYIICSRLELVLPHCCKIIIKMKYLSSAVCPRERHLRKAIININFFWNARVKVFFCEQMTCLLKRHWCTLPEQFIIIFFFKGTSADQRK